MRSVDSDIFSSQSNGRRSAAHAKLAFSRSFAKWKLKVTRGVAGSCRNQVESVRNCVQKSIVMILLRECQISKILRALNPRTTFTYHRNAVISLAMLSAKLFHSNLIASPRMIRVTIDYQLSQVHSTQRDSPDSTSKGEHVWSYNWIWICDRQKSTFDSLACEISHQDLLSSLVASQFVFVFFCWWKSIFKFGEQEKMFSIFGCKTRKCSNSNMWISMTIGNCQFIFQLTQFILARFRMESLVIVVWRGGLGMLRHSM